MKVKPLLIFPPGWVPFAPYLALPILKGFLEKHSITADIKDSNLEFYDHILSAGFVSRAYKICADKLRSLDSLAAHTDEEKDSYYRYSKAVLMKRAAKRIDKAKKVIRSGRFYDPTALEMAKKTLLDSLYIIDTAYEEYSIGFNDITHKRPLDSCGEVLNAVDSELSSIFAEYYEAGTLKEIKRNKYTLVGISVTGRSQLNTALTLAKMIRKSCPDVRHIVFGGSYITRLAAEWTGVHPFFSIFDSLVCYEGENSLLSLIRTLEAGTDLSGVPNLCYVRDGRLVRNVMSPVDITDTPVPDFDGFPLKKYFMPEPVLPVFTSRSCYLKCAFCTVPHGTYGKYRALKIEDVYRTMTALQDKYGTDKFAFVDETFTPARMRQLSETIVSGGRRFYWYCETRLEKGLSADLFRTLYEGGCRKIQFGLESYNQRILDLMKKNISAADIEPALVNCLDAGIAFHLFFMVGFPTETPREAQRTFDFTGKMLDLSWHKYANRSSSRSFGAFVLGKHSYVYDHPEEFFIRINEKSGKGDLVLNYDYVAGKGLSQREAGHLADVYYENLGELYKGCRSYHFLNKMFASEEEHFLKNARGHALHGGGAREGRRPRPSLEDYPRDSRISLSGAAGVFFFGHTATSATSFCEPAATLYDFNTRAYYQLDAGYLDILKRVKKGVFRVKDALSFPEPVKDVLVDLLYYGFFRIKNGARNKAMTRPVTQPVYNARDIKEARAGGKVYLLNLVNGKLVKTVESGLRLLKRLDGTVSPDKLPGTGRGKNAKMDSGEFQALLEEAVGMQLLYLERRSS